MRQTEAPTLFFDIGGVILTNGWDTAARKRAAEMFGLEYPEFQTRHEMLKTSFETGRLDLNGYLKKSIFYKPRAFTPEDVREVMLESSQLLGETLGFVRALAKTGKYRLFTLNNESRELHEHRVQKFGMREIFQGFLTSCYLGQVKPDEDIYINALGIAGCLDHGCALFIDDRSLNVEPALALGLNAVKFTELAELRSYLKSEGVEA